MAKKDYYETLGLSRQASDDEIKKSFKKLAMKYHPDRNPDNPQAEENFKEAKEAYEVLSDSQKRSAYDQFGHAGVDQSAGGGGLKVSVTLAMHLVIFLVIFLVANKARGLTFIVVQIFDITWKLH